MGKQFDRRVIGALAASALWLGISISAIHGQQPAVTADPNQPQQTVGQPGNLNTGTLTTCDSSLMLLYGVASRYFGYTPSAATGLQTGSFELGQYMRLFQGIPQGQAGVTDALLSGGTTGNQVTTTSGGVNQGQVTTSLDLTQTAPAGTDTLAAATVPAPGVVTEGSIGAGGGTTLDAAQTQDPSAAATGADSTMQAGIPAVGQDTLGQDTLSNAMLIGSGVLLNPPLVGQEAPQCTVLRGDLEAFFLQALQNPDFDTQFRSQMQTVPGTTTP